MYINTNELQQDESNMFMDSNYTINEVQEQREEINHHKESIQTLEEHKVKLLSNYKWNKKINTHHQERVIFHKQAIKALYELINESYKSNQAGIPA